jgi:hypothetical protein
LTWASESEFINKWIREIEIQVYELGLPGTVTDKTRKLLTRSVEAGLTGAGHKNASVAFCCLYLAIRTCGEQVDVGRLLRYPLWRQLSDYALEQAFSKIPTSLHINSCPKCGVTDDASDKFCRRCNSKLSSNLIPESELEEQTKDTSMGLADNRKDLIFTGAAAIAQGDVQKLSKPSVREENEAEYRGDLSRYGGELTVAEANRRLALTGWNRKPYPGQFENTVANYRELGQVAQFLYAEKLPSIRLWFHWKNFVIGAVPDGIADRYVYEFRATTLTGEDLKNAENQIMKQAHLYAYAFRRPEVKVQIAQFQFSKELFPIMVRDLPKPTISTVFQPAPSTIAESILSELDQAFEAHERFMRWLGRMRNKASNSKDN